MANVAVLGAGTMGHALALVFALGGHRVRLTDSDPATLERAQGLMETARRRGIAVALVVNNNSGFGQGWPNYLRQAGDRPQAAEQVLRFGPTDFAAVARNFGLQGIRVERPGDIAPALREAIAAEETVVVDVATDIEARAPEPWAPEEG